MNKLDEFELKVAKLAKEYDMEVLLVGIDNTSIETTICGTMCPVCAKALLDSLIEERNFKHTKSKERLN